MSLSSNRLNIDTIFPMGLGLFSLFISIGAMPQDLVWGDAPELAASAGVLGVPHPTGYPLYLLTTHLIQALPLGTVIFRAHLLSALFTALAAVVLYDFLKKVLHTVFGPSPHVSAFPALLAVLSFRLTPVVWEQSISTEVYALFLLLFSLTLWLMFQVLQPSSRYASALFFVIGLNLVHHRLAIFLLGGVCALLILRSVHILSARFSMPVLTDHSYFIFHKAVWALPPLLLWLYFPLRAWQDPAVNWFDPDHPRRLYQLLAGGQYSNILQQGIQMLMMNFDPGQVLYCFFLPLLCYSLISLVACLGLIIVLNRMPWLGIFTLLLYLIHQTFMLVYPVGDWSTFLLPSLILLTIPLAFGNAFLGSQIQIDQKKRGEIALLALGFALISLIPITIAPDISMAGDKNLFSFWPQPLPSIRQQFAIVNDTSATDYSNRVWAQVPEGTPIITGLMEATADNEYYPLLYQQVVEKRQPRTPIIGAGFLLYDWYRRQINEKASLNLEMRNDQPSRSREEWLEDTWNTVVNPLIQRGPVITTSLPIPPDWYPPRATIKNRGQIQVDLSLVPQSYRPYIPTGFVHQINRPPQP